MRYPLGRAPIATLCFLLAPAFMCAAATPKPKGGVQDVPAQGPPPAPFVFDPETCGAGRLPRITEATLEGGSVAFRAAAARGTVPVVWNGARARLVEGCRLDGHYSEALGVTPGAHFFGTNRVLFRTDEIDPSCRAATHVVAAYVTSQPNGPERLDAILVPLPCPPVSDARAAPGCIGAGLTGAQRHEKAAALRAKLNPEAARVADVTRPLEIFALTPDEYEGLMYVAQVDECALEAQGRWVSDQYLLVDDGAKQTATLRDPTRRMPPPHLDCEPQQRSCSGTPVFLKCFGQRFTPRFFGAGDWMCPLGTRP